MATRIVTVSLLVMGLLAGCLDASPTPETMEPELRAPAAPSWPLDLVPGEPFVRSIDMEQCTHVAMATHLPLAEIQQRIDATGAEGFQATTADAAYSYFFAGPQGLAMPEVPFADLGAVLFLIHPCLGSSLAAGAADSLLVFTVVEPPAAAERVAAKDLDVLLLTGGTDGSLAPLFDVAGANVPYHVEGTGVGDATTGTASGSVELRGEVVARLDLGNLVANTPGKAHGALNFWIPGKPGLMLIESYYPDHVDLYASPAPSCTFSGDLAGIMGLSECGAAPDLMPVGALNVAHDHMAFTFTYDPTGSGEGFTVPAAHS